MAPEAANTFGCAEVEPRVSYLGACVMEPSIGGDRRNGERRRHSATGGATSADRRKGERREFVRLHYPPAAAPEVLNTNFRIVNISREAVGLACHDGCEECMRPISLKSVLDLKIQFRDGEILDLKVKILRCRRDPKSNDKWYAGTLETPISAERIGKEQAYLLRHYPDFCRFSRASSVAHMETALYYEDHDNNATSQSTN